jgi:hypothetical protein
MFITKKSLEKMLEQERYKAREEFERERMNNEVWQYIYRKEGEFNDRITQLELATGLRKELCNCENCRTAAPKRS